MCGLFPAAEAHHWAWRYPADADVTANDLTALCRRCHWAATLLRLTGRAQAGVWFILATGWPSVRRRKRVVRHQPRSCRGPATRAPEPDLYALIERCHLVLVAGCLACERYVRLDAVLSHRPCWRSMSVTQLCRRLCCCRCRSRTRWVLLGGWPPAGPGGSAEHLRRDGAERAGHGPDRADPDHSSRDAGSRHAKTRLPPKIGATAVPDHGNRRDCGDARNRHRAQRHDEATHPVGGATTSRQLGSLPAPEDREARQGFEESGLNAAIRARGRSPGRIRNEANNTLDIGREAPILALSDEPAGGSDGTQRRGPQRERRQAGPGR